MNPTKTNSIESQPAWLREIHSFHEFHDELLVLEACTVSLFYLMRDREGAPYDDIQQAVIVQTNRVKEMYGELIDGVRDYLGE